MSYNTVFDGADIGPSLQIRSLPRYQDAASSLNDFSIASLSIGAGTKKYDPRADQNTRITNNIFDSVQIQRASCPTQPNCTPPGQYTANLVGSDTPFDIKEELRDPWNWDFRPCAGSAADAIGAGAYAARGASPRRYWIPGALEPLPSTPVPKDHGSDVALDTDLMFLGAYRAASHTVYLGPAGGEMARVGAVGGDDNVVAPPAPLSPETAYAWRVDAQFADGTARKGDAWHFATGRRMACAEGLASP